MNEKQLLTFLQENVIGMKNYLLSPNNQDALDVAIPAEILGDVVSALGNLQTSTISAKTLEVMIAGFEALYAGVAYAGQAVKAQMVHNIHREFLPEMRQQQPEFAKFLDVTLSIEGHDAYAKYITFVEWLNKFNRKFGT